MSSLTRFFATRWGPVVAGLVIGACAALLVKLGNPGNMGICVACFTRDIAGALGLHRAALVQYIRPEIIGFILGSFLTALAFREFKPRTGAAPLARFFLGMFAMFGSLVFLGCPWRTLLRLAGGDGNALFGLGGLVVGIGIGVLFLKMGYSLGRSRPAPAAMGWLMPIGAVVLLILLVARPQFGRDEAGLAVGPIFFSAKGPGSLHAPLLISLGIGLAVGFLAQRSRFCTVGAFRDVILMRDTHLLGGVVAFLAAAFAVNLLFGQFKAGFADQPVAHTNALWNFGGMLLAGLAFTLAGGCPGRQVFLSGEGDGDAGVFVLGMLAGAALSHTFNAAGSPAGPGVYSPAVVVVGIIFCAVLGIVMREPRSA